MHVRRAKYIVLTLDDAITVDIARFLRGDLQVERTARIVATAIAQSAERVALAPSDLDTLLAVPRDWVGVSSLLSEGLEEATIFRLLGYGLLLADGGDGRPEWAETRARDEALARGAWAVDAAFAHYSARRLFDGQGAAVRRPQQDAKHDPERMAAYVAEHGAPPATFVERGSSSLVPLPRISMESPLQALLRRRHTSRRFDTERTLEMADLATLLLETFGCHGTSDLGAGVTVQRRTSPSGGSLHPIEAYVLARDVAGLEPGAYHYDTSRHALRSVCAFPAQDMPKIQREACAGQRFPGGAHALVVMTARFPRSFWKYRHVGRAYGVVLIDAGHLSQTFYLVATALNLGAFFSAAIDLRAIERFLGLADADESPIGVCGCGPRRVEGDEGALLRQPVT